MYCIKQHIFSDTMERYTFLPIQLIRDLKTDTYAYNSLSGESVIESREVAGRISRNELLVSCTPL